MKGEVYGKRELSPLVGLTKKQAPTKGGGASSPSKRQPRKRK